MSERNSNSNDWQPCQPGTIGSVVSQRQRDERTRSLRRLVTIASSVAALCIIATAAAINIDWFEPPTTKEIGHISCGEVKAKLKSYIADSLDEELNDRIKKHLDECPHCAEQYEKIKKAESDSFSFFKTKAEKGQPTQLPLCTLSEFLELIT